MLSHVDAHYITLGLKGRWFGSYGQARCPAHEDRSPSLSIRGGADGRLLLHCFAGCSYEAVRDALVSLGLLEERRGAHAASQRARPNLRPARPAVTPEDRSDDAARSERALALWQRCRPAKGTAVEIYLGSRGPALPPGDMLRFHPGLKHPSGSHWPAMVALITRGTDGQPLGLHRTFLTHDGSAKAPVRPDKMMLGPTRGGVVRLGQADKRIMVGEGLETCLSVIQVMSDIPAWAALSTSGLRSLELPASVREVTVLADGDDPGERAAREAALRWSREGRCVRIAHPPLGSDFNDLLCGSASSARAAAWEVQG